MSQSATLTTTNNKTNVQLPIQEASLGPAAIVLNPLHQLNLLSYDPGFTRTAACTSKITYTDGEKGILLYRGYPIEQLAEKSEFLEVSHLLIYDTLLKAEEKNVFLQEIQNQLQIDPKLFHLLNGFSNTAHPMAIMIGLMSALAAQTHEESHSRLKDPEYHRIIVSRCLAQMPILVALCYHHTLKNSDFEASQPYTPHYAEYFLNMVWGHNRPSPKTSKILSRALERILILHADHEQNASTTVVRLTGATQANPYACFAAGLSALWGDAHGGANEACLRMLMEIEKPDRIPDYINRAKDKQDPFRLMGFGHRIYKTQDPRAKIMRQTCYEVLSEIGAQELPLFKLAMELEKIALQDSYFIERKLYPNVDFYSGIILKALGFPPNFFTVIFALSRISGWLAHWVEMITDPETCLGRPRQLYCGEAQRDYL